MNSVFLRRTGCEGGLRAAQPGAFPRRSLPHRVGVRAPSPGRHVLPYRRGTVLCERPPESLFPAPARRWFASHPLHPKHAGFTEVSGQFFCNLAVRAAPCTAALGCCAPPPPLEPCARPSARPRRRDARARGCPRRSTGGTATPPISPSAPLRRALPPHASASAAARLGSPHLRPLIPSSRASERPRRACPQPPRPGPRRCTAQLNPRAPRLCCAGGAWAGPAAQRHGPPLRDARRRAPQSLTSAAPPASLHAPREREAHAQRLARLAQR